MSNRVIATGGALPDEPTTTAPHALRRHLSAAADTTEWNQYLRDWQRTLRAERKAPATIRTYEQAYMRLVLWATNEANDYRTFTSPTELRKRDLEVFFDAELRATNSNGKPRAASTVASHHAQLRVFFNWLAEWIDEDNPRSIMRGMSAPTVPEKVTPLLVDDELAALLHACKGGRFDQRRDAAIIRILFDTGLRISEASGLLVEDVDLDQGLVIVTGKGDRQRLVPISAKTVEAVARYLAERRKHKDARLPQLWLAAHPCRGAISTHALRRVIVRRSEQAGIPNVHPHKFRHTAAHHALSSGVSETDAMTLFGWKTRAMLDRYGASGRTERAIAAARRLQAGDRI